MEISGAHMVIEALKKEGVDVIFAYPGGTVIPLFDVLYDEKDIRLVHVRHEQASAHAADGYARATGKVGVCIATSGPGATNLVTGIATAYMDSIPMVAITGQVATSLIGNDAFQEADFTGITRPITKHNYLVKDIADLPRILKEAFHIARSGRPGPVVIDLPKDVQNTVGEFNYPDKIELRNYKPHTKPHSGQVKKAMEMIDEAKKPIIYFGGGVVLGDAGKELQEFVKKTDIPVTSTLLGLGAYPADYSDPLYLGMLGMHGTVYANYAISHSDLIIAIGARFDDRVTGKLSEFAPNARIIHVDIDPTSISKNVLVDIPIVGDVKLVLKEMNKMAKKAEIADWKKEVSDWKEKHPMVYDNSGDDIKPQAVMEKLSELTNGDAIITTEVGQNQMWAAQYYSYKHSRTLLTSGGLGTMGYGFPAAVGAKAAVPKKQVICVAGDGSLQMNIQEMATCKSQDLNVKILILNNSCLGMVRQWQELFFDRRYSGTMLDKHDGKKCFTGEYYPDFVKLADAYGWWGKRISSKDEVDAALKEMLDYDGPAILDVMITKEENVFPMVPAGASLTQILGGMS